MLYGAIRIVLFAIVFTIFYILIKKSKIVKKKLFTILSLITCIIFYSISYLLPVENLFVNFKSAEEVFNYTCSGDIEDVVYGDNSCMIYYSTNKSSFSYDFVKKTTDGYKILNRFRTKRISYKFDTEGSFEIYNVLGTNDYYVFGTVDPKSTNIEVYDSSNIKIESDIKRTKETSFIYFYLRRFTGKCFLLVDGEKIFISY